MQIMSTPESPILFFDGVCGLCNRSVDFVMRRDRREVFRFAPLQGDTARTEFAAKEVEDLSTLVLKTPSGTYRRSSAVVRILWNLGGFWSAMGWVLWIIPLPLRNLGYRAVASCRYSIWGKKETCRIPSPAERGRFLP